MINILIHDKLIRFDASNVEQRIQELHYGSSLWAAATLMNFAAMFVGGV